MCQFALELDFMLFPRLCASSDAINTFRPHSKLGYLSPERFAARKSAPSPSPVGLRPPYAGDGQPNNNPLETKTTLKD